MNFLKKYINEFILAFGFSFMLYFYEPIVLYGTNINDLWFDIYLYFRYIIIIFIIMFIIFCALFILLKKIFKDKPGIDKILLAIYIYIYIEGNFLMLNSPKINATEFSLMGSDWIIGNLISAIVSIIVILSVYHGLRRKKKIIVNKTIKYSVIIISIMLTSGIISVLPTKGFFDHKHNLYATKENLNVYSENKNYIIFLIDSISSTTYNSNTKDKSVLNDFTYYKDSLSSYLFTKYSVPLILTGEKYLNDTNFFDFYSDSLDNSKLLNSIENNNYLIDLYEPEIMYNNDNYSRYRNIREAKYLNIINLIKVESRYDLYKYLPYGLKLLTNFDDINFYSIKPDDQYSFLNADFNKDLDMKVEKVEDNIFKFIHIQGGHNPYNLDENLKETNNGNHIKNVRASINITTKYINYLKENDLYDNSVIIIMSDHGWLVIDDYSRLDNIENQLLIRSNPLLYIKGIDEHHDRVESDDKVSYAYLETAFLKLLEGEDSQNLFSQYRDVEKRYLYAYNFHNDEVFDEMEQEGHAWEFEKIKPTGKVYEKSR